MNMKAWFDDVLRAERKKTMPVLSFPATSLLGVTVAKLTSDAELQAKGMKLVAERVDSLASVSMMDLSVEAEAFGASVRASDNEVPTVTGAIAPDADAVEALEIPDVGAGRTGLYVRAIGMAKEMIRDRPVFAGVIGPFSLAGRLMDVTEIMINCYEEPDAVHALMRKTTAFIIKYINAYKAVGADGALMAEPLTGLLSPDLASEFSEPYVKEIIDAVSSDDFAVIYHNCGGNTIKQIDSILRTGAAAYHFGNAIDMKQMMEALPDDVIAMGNIDPSSQFANGTPESIRDAIIKLLNECGGHKNFVISSGCDIPPQTPWKNIDAYFEAVAEYYRK